MSGMVTDALYSAGATVKIQVTDTVISIATAAFLAAVQPASGVWKGWSATAIEVVATTSGIYRAFVTDPATDGSIGVPMAVGVSILVKGWQNIKNLKLIRQGATPGDIMLTPFFNNTGN